MGINPAEENISCRRLCLHTCFWFGVLAGHAGLAGSTAKADALEFRRHSTPQTPTDV
ncbi:unnamed protein product [Larinioides sclopetarius]|uniref:Uncharacterized protein n=1 Tax=Larinioides sclopetarius TaxID=280406 RepID=A0AAV2ACA9_9ARAC